MIDDAGMLLRVGLTEKAIADALRRGPSALFCNALAAMLDPPEINWRTAAPQPGTRQEAAL